VKLQLPKGTRDLAPEQAIVRNNVISTIKNVFEKYGYNPMDTPLFERFDVLSSKYAGGAEILKETFKFKDQGDRELALRYDLTVPMCRFVGMKKNLKMPFKRYQIGEVFRDGPVEKARYRQFTQCDVDVVGIKSMDADAEIIALVFRAFSDLGLKSKIKVNNRKILNDILKNCKIEKKEIDAVILSIDKLEKFGADAVKKELKDKNIDSKKIEDILTLISINGSNSEKLKSLSKILGDSEGIEEISQLFSLLKSYSIEVEFDVSLARGLSYYTGTIVEVFLVNSKVKSSVCAGGRYDNIIGQFIGNNEYPAVGISFGLDRIYDAYIEKNASDIKSTASVFIIPIDTKDECLKIAEELRNENIFVAMDLVGKGISKNLAYANTQGIPYVLIVGQNELKQKKVKMKDMNSGEEKMMSADELVIFLQENKN